MQGVMSKNVSLVSLKGAGSRDPFDETLEAFEAFEGPR